MKIGQLWRVRDEHVTHLYHDHDKDLQQYEASDLCNDIVFTVIEFHNRQKERLITASRRLVKSRVLSPSRYYKGEVNRFARILTNDMRVGWIAAFDDDYVAWMYEMVS